jgi:cysteine desulfurase
VKVRVRGIVAYHFVYDFFFMKPTSSIFDTPRVYLDYAAATPLSPRVADVMRPFERDQFANPRSVHAFGKNAHRAFDDARSRVGKMLGVTADEIHFTGGGTDGNTKAILGVVNALQDSGRALTDMHIIVSAIEHSSVHSCTGMLSRRGVSVSHAPVSTEGIIDLHAFESLIKDTTVLVSIALVNNEIGTIQPIREITRIIEKKNAGRKHTIIMHTDASQAPLWLSVAPRELKVDLMTLDAHKLYGPKGVGALVVSYGTPYAGVCGALHEKHGTADGVEGTPNMPGIMGFTEALAACDEKRETMVPAVCAVRDYCISRITERFSDARIHGSCTSRVANNINVSFPNIDGEFLVAQLSVHGIAASAKSACLSGGEEGSHVIAALDPERKNNAVRFSLGYETTQDDIDYLISVLVDVVA